MSAGDLERWRRKQAHYQDANVVREYDARRFSGPAKSRSTARKWRAIVAGLGDEFDRVETVLDVPCGTGRFANALAASGKRFVEADLSHAMLCAARGAGTGAQPEPDVPAARDASAGRCAGAVRCDVARLPFADRSFDVVLSIRFLFHVPRELRPAILREMGRVAARKVVVDVRHKYCWTTWSKRLRATLRSERVAERYSLAEIDADFSAAGLAIVRKVWLAPGFSEKMIVVARRRDTELER